MPAEFNKLGISFLYPDNWILDEEDALAGRKSVTVYSPGGAFWSISVHPRSADPARLAKAAAEAMQEEYEDSEAAPSQETVAGRELLGYDLSFYCLDLTNTASIRSFRTNRATYTVYSQAEDREFEAMRAVFLAMTTSFLGNLQPQKSHPAWNDPPNAAE
jgi:hypothetical protein